MKVYELDYNISDSSRLKSTQYKHLSQEDIIKDTGLNYNLYLKVLKTKGISEDDRSRSMEYETRDGRAITGREFNKRYHKYQDLILLKNGVEYVVDAVHENFYFGKYISLLIRKKGSKSHGVIFWENINCYSDVILESIEEARKIYKLKE